MAEKSQNIEYKYKFKLKVNNVEGTKPDPIWIDFLRLEVLPYFEEFGDRDDFINVISLLGDAYYQNKLYKSAAETYLKINSLHLV